MSLSSRLLSRSKKLYSGHSILRHEHAATARFFSKEATPPALKGDEMLKNNFFEVKNKFETAMGISQKEKITIDPDDPATVAQYAEVMKTVTENHFSGVPLCQKQHQCASDMNLLTFIESTLDEPEGPYHCWLNKIEERGKSFSRDGIFLVIVGGFLEDSIDRVVRLERVKLLQQRYPVLHVFGFQFSSSFNSVAAQIHIVQTVMKEYIKFPILLSNKDFNKMKNGACYLLFQGFQSPMLYHEKDLDLERLVKVIEESNALQNVNAETVQNLKFTWLTVPEVTKDPFVDSTWARVPEVIKDPLACSSFRNLLLFFPGSISVDEDGDRLFISDTNHHRIIITDSNGKLLDCIGSLPGFEDGEFESAKLLRPAASFYDVDEDCLYFVDSENHAVRRANMETRVLETVYPICNSDKRVGSLWSWILDKLGRGRGVDPKPKKFDIKALTFPWHLLKSEGNDLFIINRSFETLWVMSATTAEIKEVISGFTNIMEICGQLISEKMSFYQEMNWLQQIFVSRYSIEGLPYGGLMSSFAVHQNNIIFCDPAGQRVLKCQRVSKDISDIQFSNFGILGLPHWLASPLERVFVLGDIHGRPRNDHIQHFNLLPGRCDIRVNIDLPVGTELAEPLQEGSIWRFARGSAVEFLGSESVAAASKKVGEAQQVYDELDSVIFGEPELELNVEEENLNGNSQEENKVHFDCAANISPGSSEVVIYTVLYLKLTEMHRSSSLAEGIKTARTMLDIRDDDKCRKQGGDACARLLLESCRDLRDITFMKPLHLRIRLDVDDYPVADKDSENLREMVLPTDSFIKVNVSLE
ncbi:hypothetical protein AAC387_Pa02g2629 [Persea americana]